MFFCPNHETREKNDERRKRLRRACKSVLKTLSSSSYICFNTNNSPNMTYSLFTSLTCPLSQSLPQQLFRIQQQVRNCNSMDQTCTLEHEVTLLQRRIDQLGMNSSHDYLDFIKECGKIRSVGKGKWYHCHILRNGFHNDKLLTNLVMEMYGKCASLDHARLLFERMRVRNLFSWTILISAYAGLGLGKEARDLLGQMQVEGVKPNQFTVSALLKSCDLKFNAFAEVKIVHAYIIQIGFKSDTVVGTAIINMYAYYGSLKDVQDIFNGLSHRDIVCWSAMIAANAQHGYGNEAILLLREMEDEGLAPDIIALVSILDACADPVNLPIGKKVHACIIVNGFEYEIIVGTALLNLYGKSRYLDGADRVFAFMSIRNVFLWTALIAAYVQDDKCPEAVYLFQQMLQARIKPDKVLFLSVLGACGSFAMLPQGKLIHSHIIELGFEGDIMVANSLVVMYGKCMSPAWSLWVFERMNSPSLISWSAIIGSGSYDREAFLLFSRMLQEITKPDIVTFIVTLNSCEYPTSLPKGKWIHACIHKMFDSLAVPLANAVINMYAKCCSPYDARLIFDRLEDRSIVTWNSMITAYAEVGQDKDALLVYNNLHEQGYIPEMSTFLSILSTCIEGKTPEQQRLHTEIIKSGFQCNVKVSSCLITMLGRCGNLDDAICIFDRANHHDAGIWTALIFAYSMYGHGIQTIKLFSQMRVKGFLPDKTTLASLLASCSHAGLLDEGCHYFVSAPVYGVPLVAEHYGCLVDLLARVAQVDEAEELISSLPLPSSSILWMVLLDACRNRGMGKCAAIHIFEIGQEYS